MWTAPGNGAGEWLGPQDGWGTADEDGEERVTCYEMIEAIAAIGLDIGLPFVTLSERTVGARSINRASRQAR